MCSPFFCSNNGFEYTGLALSDCVRHTALWRQVGEAVGGSGFSREFILETDASLNGLGAILSQHGKDREIHVITYASHSLCPSERSMHNYSSVKLKLLALKWAVTETFWNYLLGS